MSSAYHQNAGFSLFTVYLKHGKTQNLPHRLTCTDITDLCSVTAHPAGLPLPNDTSVIHVPVIHAVP